MNKQTDSDFNVDSVIEAISVLDSLSTTGEAQEESELAKKLINYLRAVQEELIEITYVAGDDAIGAEKLFLGVLEEVLREEEFELEDDEDEDEDEDDLDQTSSEVEEDEDEDEEEEEEDWEDMDDEEKEDDVEIEKVVNLLKDKGMSAQEAMALIREQKNE